MRCKHRVACATLASLVVLAPGLPASAAGAAPTLQSCLAKALAALPPKARAQVVRDDAGPDHPDLEAIEKRALASPVPIQSLVLVVQTEVAVGARKRAARLVARMEAAPPPKETRAKVDRRLYLARAEALIGNAKRARAHLAAARPGIYPPGEPGSAADHRRLLVIALTLHDQAMATKEQALFFQAIDKSRGNADPRTEAYLLASDGFGRRALRLADRYRAYRDQVIKSILEGAQVDHDYSLEIEMLGKLDDARRRLLEVEQVWGDLSPGLRRGPAFMNAVRGALAVASQPGVDDFARSRFVEVLAGLGLVRPAQRVARRIADRWARAHAEGLIAQALAVTHPAAGAALAHKVIRLAATRGHHFDADENGYDSQAARTAAVAALARSGRVATARRYGKPGPTDVVVGLRHAPRRLARWWRSASRSDRVEVLEAAIQGWLRVPDTGFLLTVCR